MLFTTVFSSAFAQNMSFDEYRSESNPYYWKNRLPKAGYWQQDVHYTIEATINDSAKTIEANKYELIYVNNSPDTLTYVYFHLYQNAFQPGSHMESLYKNNGKKVTFGPHESKKLGTLFRNLKANGKDVQTELDNTILKVFLNEPLQPGGQLNISMQFTTYFDEGGSLRRRMKTFETNDTRHFDGVHWYPSIAVYDQKFGWTTEQHMDKEFYADFGIFDIKLTFANDYIVEATGELINRKEVMPDELRQKLDLENFKKRKGPVSKPVIRNGTTKTWHFIAANVHNFAFTADPLYRIGEVEWEGVRVISMVQEMHAPRWQQSAEFTKKVIQVYSTDFGMYAWPKIIVADANDGMEYPMITLDGGSYPGHQGLLAHEVGHMWFYGMVGSNETYRALMDEGFTQFLTVWSLDAINGPVTDYKELRSKKELSYAQKHSNPRINRYEKLYYPYVKLAHMGQDHQLNTHSSDFNGAVRHGGGYGHVYFKTGVMLYNLQYVLGEELFLHAMKNYFNTWKMCHPYPEDFRQSIISYTKVDLNWFFDQWLETTKKIDYGIKSVKKNDEGNYDIVFYRKGRMQMPVDFIVVNNNNDTSYYHIPNTWFQKSTEATILPKWYGWDNINPEYTANVSVTGKIKNVIIDPEWLMADIDLRNNSWKTRARMQFDHRVPNYPNWYTAEHFHHPDLWFNTLDGIQAGWHFNGNYLKQTSIYRFTAWLNTEVLSYENSFSEKPVFSFDLYNRSQLRHIWDEFYFDEYGSYNVGLAKAGLSLVKTFKPKDYRKPQYTRVSLSADLLYRYNNDYLIYPSLWSSEQFNNSTNFRVERKYSYHKGSGIINAHYRIPGMDSDFNYSYFELSAVNTTKLKNLVLRTRWYIRHGVGNIPAESQLYLTGANPEDLYGNKYTRATGFIPDVLYKDPVNSNTRLQMGGGLNLRGHVNETNYAPWPSATNSFSLSTLTGTSISGELDFQQLFPFKFRKMRNIKKYLSLATYLFSDIGLYRENSSSDFNLDGSFFDAGIGMALALKFGRLDIKPLTLRCDIPLVVNQSLEPSYIFGINRSF